MRRKALGIMNQHCLNLIKRGESSCSDCHWMPAQPSSTSERSRCLQKKLPKNSPISSPGLFPASPRLRLRDFLNYSLVAWILFFHWSPYVCVLWTCLVAFEQVSRRWLESGMTEIRFMERKRWEKTLFEVYKKRRGRGSGVPQ